MGKRKVVTLRSASAITQKRMLFDNVYEDRIHQQRSTLSSFSYRSCASTSPHHPPL